MIKPRISNNTIKENLITDNVVHKTAFMPRNPFDMEDMAC